MNGDLKDYAELFLMFSQFFWGLLDFAFVGMVSLHAFNIHYDMYNAGLLIGTVVKFIGGFYISGWNVML